MSNAFTRKIWLFRSVSRRSPFTTRHSLSAIFFFLFSIFGASSAFSLDPSLDISQYAHTVWKVRDGFVPGAILAIAQTPDGYLWLGTEFGLYRFDGVRAVPWQPPAGQTLPDNSVSSLLVSRDGTLWIGTLKGLASWKDGKVSRYQELTGLAITSLLEDHEGTMWVGEWRASGIAVAKLCTIRNGAVECSTKDESLGWGALSLFEDSKGDLWVGGGGPPNFGFWHWKPGPPKFYSEGPNVVYSFFENTDGTIYLAIQTGIQRFVDGKLDSHPLDLPKPLRDLNVTRLQRDRDGNLWVGFFGGGLAHVHRGRIDEFAEADGLSGDQVTALFQDREGNFWVATSKGLDRFRNFAIPTWSARQRISLAPGGAVLSAQDGGLWVAVVRGLAKLGNDQVTIYSREQRKLSAPAESVHQVINRQFPQGISALLQDHSGRLWVSSSDGIGYLDEREQFHPVAPFGTRVITSLTEAPNGNVWVLDQENGLFCLRDAKVVQHLTWGMLGRKDYGWRVLGDRKSDGLWIAFTESGLAYFQGGHAGPSYSTSDGLGEGFIRDIRFGSSGTLWAATEGGLSLIRAGHVETLTTKNGLPCERIYWSIEDDDRFVWLYTACGLVRIAASELDAWAGDSRRKVQVTVFDASDGVRTAGDIAGYGPQDSKGTDGRIWFNATDGVSVIDPRHLPHNDLPPPVHIEQITADGKSYDSYAVGSGRLKLPALVRYLDVDYTALSLVVPEKVRFRVKLEGQDKDWRELVNVRRVSYTNLGPKHYRFLVKACNNSGVWNEEGAALEFVIPPAWYQTNWFRALCVTAFLALLWALYQYRLHQMAQQFNMRLEERVGERTRIARDLHDTLLQNFQAVLLLLQAVSHELPEGKTKNTLNRTIEHAARAITEGRDTVQGLRTSTVESNDLALGIRTLGAELGTTQNDSPRPDFIVQLEGVPQNLHPIVRDEVYRVAGEAVRNAFHHAKAQRIEVEIRYDEDQLRVRVRDDGKGIDPQQLDGDGRRGHFGLPGMRERAKLVGGNLRLWSKPEAGTEVELTIPAKHAYRTSGEKRRSWFIEKLRGRETERKP